MPIFEYGKGPVRNVLRGIGDGVRSAIDDIPAHMEGSLNNFTGNRDYQLAVDQFDYQKDLNQTIMDREDTAMQRKVADMEAAGINPMAMFMGSGGSGASASPLRTSGGSVQRGSPGAGVAKGIGTALQIAQFDADIAIKRAQADMLKAQTSKLTQDVEYRPREFELESERVKGYVAQVQSTIERNGSDVALNRVREDAERANIDLREAQAHTEGARQALFSSQTELTKASTSRENQQVLVLAAQVEYYNETSDKLRAEVARLEHDTDWYRSRGLPTNIGFDQLTRPLYMLDSEAGARRTGDQEYDNGHVETNTIIPFRMNPQMERALSQHLEEMLGGEVIEFGKLGDQRMVKIRNPIMGEMWYPF